MLITSDTFQDMHDVPSLQAPATARGPALLDDNDAFHMGEFFNRLGTGETEQQDFTFGDSVNGKNNQGFSWPEELPPTFMGSMTSLEHPLSRPPGSTTRETTLAHDYTPEDANSGGYGSFLEAPDVLAAASSLVHNRQHGHPNDLTNHSFPNSQAAHIEATTLPLRYTHQYHGPDHLQSGLYFVDHPNGRLKDHEQSASVLSHEDTVLRDIVLGPSHSSEQSSAITIKHVDLHWGSDQSFFENGFVPPAHQISVERLTQSLLCKMECLEPQPSTNSTRPSSPLPAHPPKRTWEVNAADHIQMQIENGTIQAHDTAYVEARSRAKRRKGKVDRSVTISKEHGEMGRDDGLFVASDSQTRDCSSTSSSIKRRSPKSQETPKRSMTSSEPRSGRTNLTPIQKRENHVRSEQKRREIIKQGFDDLVEMVPGLHGGGFSKGAILNQAADWLEDLVQGNVQLRRQLAQVDNVVIDLEDEDGDAAFQ